MSDDDKKEPNIFDFLARASIILPLLLFVNWIWPSSFPIPLWEHWNFHKENMQQALKDSVPIFIWAASITFITGLFASFEKHEIRNTNKILHQGFFVSMFAGVVEEFLFRWLFFYSTMIGLQVAAFLFFGWISDWFEIDRLLFQYIVQPIMEFVSFNMLDWVFEKPWVIACAIVTVNATFRDGHKYLGILGWLNSWVIGFFLFWIMFKYGVPAAIVVHFSYDFLIYIVLYMHATARSVITPPQDDYGSGAAFDLPNFPRRPQSRRRVYR